jgi:ribosomal-protein-alanine N-acetyltransferase
MAAAVLYRWKLKAGRNDEFREAWAEGTRKIHAACGSFGARLHEGADGVVWSYASWPSEDVRKACFVNNDWFSQDCFKTMQDCIEQRFDEIPLNVTADELHDKAHPPKPPELTTDRLILRPMVIEDAESLFTALGDEKNMKYWSRGPLASVEETREYIGWNISYAGAECFAVARRDAPELALGWVVLIDRKPAEAEIGFMFRPDVQRQGIAFEAVRRALQHGFEARGLRRVYGDADPDNTGSVKLLEKLGFLFEGRARAQWNTHIGVRDSVIYARLASDPGPD